MNNAKTKLKKNYLALAIAIALLGVISVALFCSTSFAREKNISAENNFATEELNSYSFTVLGKAINPSNDPLVGARVSDEWGKYTTTTGADGSFSFTIVSEYEGYEIGHLDISSDDGKLWYYVNDYEQRNTNADLGIIKITYFSLMNLKINGSYYADKRELGTWYWNDDPMCADINGGVLAVWFYNASYNVNGNVLTVTYDDTSMRAAGTFTFRFDVASDHNFIRIDANQSNNSLDTTSLIPADLNINAVVDNPGPVPPVPTVYPVTFGENISKVLANGVEITSGTEVEEGTGLQIVPALADKKVTKVYVNDSVCPLCQTTVNSNINIEGQMYDSVKLSGRVLADNEKQTNVLKTISKAFIDTAYAAEVGVDGAVITFTDATDGWYTSAVSDGDAYFELSVVKGNSGKLTVVKDGYENYVKDINGADLSNDFVINPVLYTTDNPGLNVITNNTAQTGDNMQFVIMFVIMLAFSFMFFIGAKKPNGAHIK